MIINIWPLNEVGMLFKSERQKNIEGVDTIIGPTVSVEGNFKGDGNIIVEGEVKGNLKTKGYLKATESSNIIANITAGSAEIAGQLIGNAKIKENLDIKESALIQGDIETGMITVAYGAVINGNLKMKGGAVEKASEVIGEAGEEKK